MVIRQEEKEQPKKTLLKKKTDEPVEEPEAESNDIPMIPNYQDLILGELNANRIATEKLVKLLEDQ
jgi:hypothetical protein